MLDYCKHCYNDVSRLSIALFGAALQFRKEASQCRNGLQLLLKDCLLKDYLHLVTEFFCCRFGKR